MKHSNFLALACASVAAAAPSSISSAKRSTPDSSCSDTQITAIENAQAECVKYANAGIVSSSDATLMDTIFHATDETSMATVKNTMTEIAAECKYGSGGMTLTCGSDNSDQCVGEVYAVTFRSDNKMVLCDPFFDMALSTACKQADQGLALVHESSHYVASTSDNAYGYSDDVALSSADALDNADSYGYFAKHASKGC